VRKEFHLEQYRYRLASYPAVMQTLGAVSDVGFKSGKNDTWYQSKEVLQATPDSLYDHLYGAAGLLMTMPTRNHLHAARQECLAFFERASDERPGAPLVKAFFDARRYLRADLELIDHRTPENLEALVKRLGDETDLNAPMPHYS
jgi:hypothetical protein